MDARTRICEISASDARQWQEAGALLIDVREAEDFCTAHAEGAISLSRGVLEMKIEEVVPNIATPLVLYCGGGNRSALAVDSLQEMGYSNAVSLAGGFKAWKEQQLPTVEGA